jgi:nucleotide-binding universal stress UspA family protein
LRDGAAARWRFGRRRATLSGHDQEVRTMNGPVICGIDESGSAPNAIRMAGELAERYALPLLYVHVVELPGSGQRAEEALREAGARGAELLVESGHPADRLVELAGEREASFLVVGSHGPRSSLLGSISADVSRRAPCPVLVVPPTAKVVAARPESDDGLGAVGGIVRFGLAAKAR